MMQLASPTTAAITSSRPLGLGPRPAPHRRSNPRCLTVRAMHWGKSSEKEQAAATGSERSDPSLLRSAANVAGVPPVVSDSVESVLSWLKKSDDGTSGSSHSSSSSEAPSYVSRAANRLLDAYKKTTGEEFRGTDKQWDRLEGIARTVLGNPLTKTMLKRLVNSYIAKL